MTFVNVQAAVPKLSNSLPDTVGGKSGELIYVTCGKNTSVNFRILPKWWITVKSCMM